MLNVKYGQYLVDDNPDDRVFILPTLPDTVEQAEKLYGSTYTNCIRKMDLDNITQRWLMHIGNELKRGKRHRKLMSGRLACDFYVSKSGDNGLSHYELVALFQSMVGTVVADIKDIYLWRIRVRFLDENTETPFVIGHIRDYDESKLDELLPEFTSSFLESVLDSLTLMS